MAGLLGYVAAGALQGVGRGMVEEARAKREMFMEELREQRLTAREERQFDRQNQLLDRQQNFQMEQNNRQHERAIATSGKPVEVDGRTRLLRQDGSLGDITDGGEVFTGRIGGSGERSFEFERKYELARRFFDDQTAFEIATGSRSASPREVREMARREAEMMMPTDRLGNVTMSPEERKDLIDKTYDELMGLFGSRGRAGQPAGGGSPTTAPAQPPGAQPYTGDAPPPGFPDAQKAPDGFWYVQRDGSWQKVVGQ